MSDLISRQAAIDALTALEEPAPTARHLSAIYDCEDAIKALPSAQPQLPEWAKKVEEYRQSAPQHIHNPLAWALYQVWKEIAADGGDKR